ncbi:MAG: RNA pseudouridine synthase [Gammaproteobacteria bacterium]|nr:RNA pseudouridine synthase [Gammaproteobacteria bacterium]
MPNFQTPFELHIRVGAATGTINETLAGATGLSKTRLKQVMQKGAVWLSQGRQTKRVRRTKKIPPTGSIIHLYYNEALLDQAPPAPKLIADEDLYSIWEKPCGLLSQGSKWGDHHNIHRWVEQHHQPQKPAFIVHRLDRATRGLMIVAHSKKVAVAFSRQLQTRAIGKYYLAVVHGHFPATNKTGFYKTPLHGRSALTEVKPLQYDPIRNYSLMWVRIHTGRKHQIRLHLSEAGYPIVGDRLYGQDDNRHDLQLTAYKLAFTCPVEQIDQAYQLSPDLIMTPKRDDDLRRLDGKLQLADTCDL